MIDIASLNQHFLVSLLIIVIGFVAGRIGLLKEEDKGTLSKILFNITLPALIIRSLQNDLDSSVLIMLIFGFGFGAFMTVVSWFIGRNKERSERGLYAMTLPGFNVGLFAFPLVEAIWGIPALVYVIMFDMGNAYIIFGSSYFFSKFYTGEPTKMSIKVLFSSLIHSVPFMTYNIALLFNLVGGKLPNLIMEVVGTLGSANTPVAFLLLGMSIKPSFDKDTLRILRNILLSRYVLGGAFGILMYLLLPIHPILSPLLLIVFLLPVSMTTLPYSVQLGYDVSFIGTVNSITIIFSYFVIWVVAVLSIM
ncbi:AEC family transporter [Alkalibacter rhizosphaerae]|uniref:AEC family transporter n=1 Tax=Alkalibacter rhizosphaerae TaxID=2815577 RepID=A0A975AJ48_9FIRM|nr:AEC family transporter [Alkalibacter rhizosphaerae]QSX09205.1 AEC family transporter [Alkalibacter rhizosphaerae]